MRHPQELRHRAIRVQERGQPRNRPKRPVNREVEIHLQRTDGRIHHSASIPANVGVFAIFLDVHLPRDVFYHRGMRPS